MSIFQKFTGNMKKISVQDMINYVEGVPGAYVECDADQRSATLRPPEGIQSRSPSLWPQGWLVALRAPANRSKLGLLGHGVLIAIGTKHWSDHCDIPQDPEFWDDSLPQKAWAEAMAKMKSFYLEVANRQGIQL